MDFQLEMDKAYEFPCDKLRPCPALPADAPSPAVVVACGAFNPAHRAHVALYEAARTALEAAGRPVLGGYFSPVSDAYGKPGLLEAWKRVGIAAAVVQPHPAIMVDTWEARQPEYTRTLRVLEHLQSYINEYYHSTRVSVVMVCGEDLYKSFFIPGVWPLDLLKKLLDTFQLVVVEREDVPNMKVQTDNTTLTGTASDGSQMTLDISGYPFIRTTFATPDKTCSSDIRAIVSASPDEATAINSIAPLVGNHKAASLVCRFYGQFHTAPEIP